MTHSGSITPPPPSVGRSSFPAMMPSHEFRPRLLPTEILDTLPVEHPAARASRRDLRIFNQALGNPRWLATTVNRLARTGERVLELGAGVGEMADLVNPLAIQWDGLDRAPRPAHWPAGSRWHQVDIRTFDRWADYRVIAANLFFHHFDDDGLSELGQRIARHTRLLVIGDLRRGLIQQWLFSAFAHLIRAHRISRHDGWLSIRAGFRAEELPDRLGLHPDEWQWKVGTNLSGAYRLIAERRP